jgi:hypothetical protein
MISKRRRPWVFLRTSTRLLELEDEVWSSKAWVLMMDLWELRIRVWSSLLRGRKKRESGRVRMRGFLIQKSIYTLGQSYQWLRLK